MDSSLSSQRNVQALTDLARQAEQAFQEGKLQDSLLLFERCLEYAKSLSPAEQVTMLLKVEFAPGLYTLGRTLCDQENFATGIRSLKHIVEIEHNAGDLRAQASILSDIATIHFNYGYYDEALHIYTEQVLPLRVQMSDTVGEARAYKAIGLVYARQHKISETYSAIYTSIEKAISAGATQETKMGLETVIVLKRKGLEVPSDLQERFREFAQNAQFWDLESQFRKANSSSSEAEGSMHFGKVHIFVSYSHHDRDIVPSICEWISFPSFDIFIDTNRLYSGWKWEEILTKALDQANILLLLIGNDTMDRPYVRKEIETYLALSSKRAILPVLLPGYVGDLPDELSSYQWYDLREGEGTGKEHVRWLRRTIWNAVYLPEPELAKSTRGPNITPSQNIDKEMYTAGNMAMSPTVVVQLVNMGVVQIESLCVHQELDMATLASKKCDTLVKILCIGCGEGACSNLFHVYVQFCTMLPSKGERVPSIFDKGTKLFYWCPNCLAPICTHCLGINDHYPCPPDQVLQYRFRCPACQKIAQVVPIFDVDFKDVAETLLLWSRSAGPPKGL